MPELVDTLDGARRLAARIMSTRERPLVVVSTNAGSSECALDAARIASECDGLADPTLISPGPPSIAVRCATPSSP